MQACSARAAGSNGDAPLPAEPAVAGPNPDYWEETDTHWIRFHVVPRFTFLYPPDTTGGPAVESIGPLRETHMVFTDGTRDVRTHTWNDPRHAKAKTRMKWTGRSLFRKVLARPADTAEVETSGAPIRPGSSLLSVPV